MRLLDFRDCLALDPSGLLGSDVVIVGGEVRVGSYEGVGFLPECKERYLRRVVDCKYRG